MSNKFKCPECGGDLIAWADLDAMITFKVNKDGKLTEKTIKNTHQGDGRCGVECTKCDWEINHLDVPSNKNIHFDRLANEVLSVQDKIKLLKEKY